jgi:hypothetical protein
MDRDLCASHDPLTPYGSYISRRDMANNSLPDPKQALYQTFEGTRRYFAGMGDFATNAPNRGQQACAQMWLPASTGIVSRQ